MVYDVILGRSEKDRKIFGTKGAVFLGKQYIQMGQTASLSNPIYMDVTRSHVVLVVGKRGSGKSYSMGVMAEGMSSLPAEISDNISVIILDTMGVYWTMKYPNKRDALLLQEWNLEPQKLKIRIFTPVGYYKDYKEKGIPTDAPFSIRPSELAPEDWFLTFDITANDPIGVLIERIILSLKKEKQTFSIVDIIQEIRKDTKSEKNVRDAAENRFLATLNWGVFSEEGTPLKSLAKGGQVTVLDLSCYATMPGGWRIKTLVVGIVSMRLFIERMIARKMEEFESIRFSEHYLIEEAAEKKKMPLVWLIIDEAHEFLPLEGRTSSTDALITLLREGRQPGISLIMATQQPGKIHSDVMTQADILIGHRITAKIDTEALANLMQSYLRSSLDKELNILPRTKGAAVAVDDTNERLYSMAVRPRFTWHGGEAPSAMPEKKD